MNEQAFHDQLHRAAIATYGDERAAQLDAKLKELSAQLALIDQQPLDLLDEEPDDAR